MNQTQSTHYTLQATFDLRDVERARTIAGVLKTRWADRLTVVRRSGTKITVQGTDDNIRAWLSDMKATGAVSGLLYAGLHANFTHAKPV